LAFLTDADLPAARIAHQGIGLAVHAADTEEIGTILSECEFAPEQAGFTAAHSSSLDPCIGDGWLAAGDASMTFDPLSSQGLLHALFTGSPQPRPQTAISLAILVHQYAISRSWMGYCMLTGSI
jgi:hypothetical protein